MTTRVRQLDTEDEDENHRRASVAAIVAIYSHWPPEHAVYALDKWHDVLYEAEKFGLVPLHDKDKLADLYEERATGGTGDESRLEIRLRIIESGEYGCDAEHPADPDAEYVYRRVTGAIECFSEVMPPEGVVYWLDRYELLQDAVELNLVPEHDRAKLAEYYAREDSAG